MGTFRQRWARVIRASSSLGCVWAADYTTDTNAGPNRVTGARQDRRPMHKMDKFPRPIVRRRIKTRMPMQIRARPNILARRLTRIRTQTSPRPHPGSNWPRGRGTDSRLGPLISLARTNPVRTRVRRVRPRRLLLPVRSRCRAACCCRFAPVSRWIPKK